MDGQKRIRDDLVRRGENLLSSAREPKAFTGDPDADRLVNDLENHPHAFVIACVMDRQIKAERAWRIPYAFAERLGGFTMPILEPLSEARIRQIMRRGRLHRFPDEMARNFRGAVQHIAGKYERGREPDLA
jgi:hypothetical protein